MQRLLRGLFILTGALLLPAAVFAQGTITGTVKDTSGAVLPGVTVEAASPVLIEKTRSVVSDGSGQYRIVDLRPGTYTVTFTLPGFNTVKRDGVELTGSFTASINADLKVGSLEETITVTGETPIVDVQSTTKQRVLGHDQIDSLPTGRLYAQLGALVPGVNSSQVDVGGAAGDAMAALTAHGSAAVDMRVTQNGVTTATLQAGGGIGMATPNVNAAQEVTVDSAGVDASLATGGPRVNFIPRDGGNTYKASIFASAANNSLQGDNLTDDLKARGLTVASSIKTVFDINPGFGGPIKKDKIWFWYTGRWNHADNYTGGMFINKNANLANSDPNSWIPVADPSQQAFNNIHETDNQVRLTFQASPRNKFAGTWDQQTRCNCPFYNSATRTPEAGNDRRSPTQRLLHGEWTSPVTSRLLLEVVGLHRTERWGNMPPALEGYLSGSAPGAIQITDQNAIYNGVPVTNLQFRGGGTGGGTYNNTWVPNYFYRAAVSYVTGAHSFKAGFNDAIGYLENTTYNYVPYNIRVNSAVTATNPLGLPVANQITQFSTPLHTKADQNHDLGLFAQDKWTLNRLTLSGGLRFDWFNSSFPEQTVGPSIATPNRNLTFAPQDNLNWKDIEPRMGAVYDLLGNGKTAVRVSANKYLNGQGLNALGGSPNPISTLTNSTTRTWTDTNKNLVPDCVLAVLSQNGECAAVANSNFGQTATPTLFDRNLLQGWGHRNANWEFSTGVQQQILPRVSVDFAYFRRVFSNFQVTDNILVPTSGYDKFSVLAPVVTTIDGQTLPSGGQVVNGFFNVNPAYVVSTGALVQNCNTLAEGGAGQTLDLPAGPLGGGARPCGLTNYGSQYQHWNGFDFSVNARLPQVTLQGGFGTGYQSTDECKPDVLVPEQVGTGSINTCKLTQPWLTSVKLSGTYTIPKVDVRVSGTYQSQPGPNVTAAFTATSAYLASAANNAAIIAAGGTPLGRPLSNAATSTTVALITPQEVYGERLHQLDFRFGKVLKIANTRSVVSVDLYNALNKSTVLTQSNNLGSNLTGWTTPQSLLTARFLKFGVQFDF